MVPKDNERLQKFYKEALNEFGDHDARSVHWSSEDGQMKRFMILSQIADLDGKTVLDVGCGLGDLYKFFIDHRIDAAYSGIDIVPDFVMRARERFPHVSFECKDVGTITAQYDYILASGALSFKIKDYKKYYFELIKKMYEHANKGLAFNMLNNSTHVDDETYAAYIPDEVADFCKGFCSRVEIIIGYLPQDFTLYLYKE